MNRVGSGMAAAVALRRRILDLLGAEPQWLTGDDSATVIAWKPGPAVTFFRVTPPPPGGRDVGVLRVSTPVARAGNTAAATDLCLGSNTYLTTSRWRVVPAGGGEGAAGGGEGAGGRSADLAEDVELSCAFVIGQDSLPGLEGFVLWCVQEQVAMATAQMLDGFVAKEVAGQACHYGGFPGGERDDPDSWHPVTRHLQQVLAPNRDLPSEGLADQLQAAFRDLRAAMLRDGTSAWFSAQDSPPLLCEMPFSWHPYPGGVIGGRGGRGLPTALVQGMYNGHPNAGNGLLITMYIPVSPPGDIADVANNLNLADAAAPWATHSIGGWSLKDDTPVYVVYLPAVLARQDIDIPALMREILLTLARQALLARRIVLPPDALEWEDKNALTGLAAPQVRHGLAWGETEVG